ncbi:MAG: hypothetical protein Q9186_002241 [Xanthomendoza sp. 1 TL-2023]
MPPEVNIPTIYIVTPRGISGVPNPLYSYQFHPVPSSTDFPPTGPPGSPPIWSFPNTAITGEWAVVGSGNGGHMSNIPYSSFDPIFWLHHTNTDRLFALWQAIYPDSQFTSQISAFKTFTNDAGKIEDANTPLTPFHSDDSGTLWTSNSAWSTKTFGYSYPEIVDWGVNSSQLSSNVKSRLNAIYNPTSTTSKRSVSGADASSELGLSPNTTSTQWFANIRVSKSDIASPFFVHLYLGPAPADSSTWSFAPNLIGSHSVIDSSMLSTADAGPPTTLYGQLPLNHALLTAGSFDLAPSKIVPLLTSQLNWRLQSTSDAPLDVSKVPSLKIHVVGQEVKPRVSDDEFPEYGHLVAYRDVTKGKAGGLQDGDDTE